MLLQHHQATVFNNDIHIITDLSRPRLAEESMRKALKLNTVGNFTFSRATPLFDEEELDFLKKLLQIKYDTQFKRECFCSFGLPQNVRYSIRKLSQGDTSTAWGGYCQALRK
jgi:hypothetical protein